MLPPSQGSPDVTPPSWAAPSLPLVDASPSAIVGDALPPHAAPRSPITQTRSLITTRRCNVRTAEVARNRADPGRSWITVARLHVRAIRARKMPTKGPDSFFVGRVRVLWEYPR
jgi:hypothetical protein